MFLIFPFISIHAPTRGATREIIGSPFLFLFQSTLPQGERQHYFHICHFLEIFQSTLPQGERLEKKKWKRTIKKFQSTLPQGERRYLYKSFQPYNQFQSTLPQGERLTSYRLSSVHAYFNPRSHKGSDTDIKIYLKTRHIFQSTLPQGERPFSNAQYNASFKFQSTLPQGERPISFRLSTSPSLFQSTLPQGERLHLQASANAEYYISIHAPTRGATSVPVSEDFSNVFQSTLPQGERLIFQHHSKGNFLFQSTLPQGERPNRFLSLPKSYNYFNPRSHKGSDINPGISDNFLPISIHAPTRGATAIFPNFRPCITLNIPKFYQYHSFFLIICS